MDLYLLWDLIGYINLYFLWLSSLFFWEYELDLLFLLIFHDIVLLLLFHELLLLFSDVPL